MSWFAEEALGHEGSKVGVLKLDDGLRGTRYLATVDAPDPSVEITSVHYACAECDCGWRSERISVAEPMTWRDGWLECSALVNARLERLWVEHIALVSYRLRLAHMPAARERIAAQLIASFESVERCTCGHHRVQHSAMATDGSLCSGWDDFPSVIAARAASPTRCPCRGFRFMPTPA